MHLPSLFHIQGKFRVQIHINFLPVKSNWIRPAVGSSGVTLYEDEEHDEDEDEKEEDDGNPCIIHQDDNL